MNHFIQKSFQTLIIRILLVNRVSHFIKPQMSLTSHNCSDHKLRNQTLCPFDHCAVADPGFPVVERGRRPRCRGQPLTWALFGENERIGSSCVCVWRGGGFNRKGLIKKDHPANITFFVPCFIFSKKFIIIFQFLNIYAIIIEKCSSCLIIRATPPPLT